MCVMRIGVEHKLNKIKIVVLDLASNAKDEILMYIYYSLMRSHRSQFASFWWKEFNLVVSNSSEDKGLNDHFLQIISDRHDLTKVETRKLVYCCVLVDQQLLIYDLFFPITSHFVNQPTIIVSAQVLTFCINRMPASFVFPDFSTSLLVAPLLIFYFWVSLKEKANLHPSFFRLFKPS